LSKGLTLQTTPGKERYTGDKVREKKNAKEFNLRGAQLTKRGQKRTDPKTAEWSSQEERDLERVRVTKLPATRAAS